MRAYGLTLWFFALSSCALTDALRGGANEADGGAPPDVREDGALAPRRDAAPLGASDGGHVVHADAAAPPPRVAFRAPLSLAIRLPRMAAIADLNADGRDDLVVTNLGTYFVLVYLQDANGTLASPQTVPALGATNKVAIHDLDGNGRRDLVVSRGAEIAVLLQSDAPAGELGSFAVSGSYGTGASAETIAVGDLDGDSWPDLAVANMDAHTVSVLFGRSDAPGTFASAMSVPIGHPCSDVAIGDFNGDQRPDLVVASGGDGALTLLLQSKEWPGVFAVSEDLASGQCVWGVAVADLNADGRDDVVAADSCLGAWIRMQSTTVTGLFLPVVYLMEQRGTKVAAGRIDQDVRIDLALSDVGGSQARYLLQDVTGGAFSSTGTLPANQSPDTIALGDLNSDGKIDLAVANILSDDVTLFLQD